MAIARPTQSIERIRAANDDAYDAETNPGGLAEGGHRQNFTADLGATVDVAQWAESLAADAARDAALTEEDAQNTKADRLATGQDRSAAAGSAGQAASSATQSAASAARFQGTSATARTPAIGAFTFTTEAGKAFDVGTWLTVQSRGTAGRWAFGKVMAYAGTNLTVDIVAIGPTVSAGSDWNLLVAGALGPIGPTGPESWATPVAWASGVSYSATAPRSVVVYEGEAYVCVVAHVSSTTFNAANWRRVSAKATVTDAINDAAAYSLAFGGM